MRSVSEKICPTCEWRKPEISEIQEALKYPVTGCKKNCDIGNEGFCSEYTNMVTKGKGIPGPRPIWNRPNLQE